MLLIADFVRDVERFRRSGQLRRMLALVAWRREVWMWLLLLGGLAGYLYATDWSAANEAGLALLLVVILYWQCCSFVVRYLSPLQFGRIATARLARRQYAFYLGASTYLDFVLLPGGMPLHVGLVGRGEVGGTVGQSYVVLLHPTNDRVALAIIDDDAPFATAMLDLVDARRRSALSAAIAALRKPH